MYPLELNVIVTTFVTTTLLRVVKSELVVVRRIVKLNQVRHRVVLDPMSGVAPTLIVGQRKPQVMGHLEEEEEVEVPVVMLLRQGVKQCLFLRLLL